MEHPLRSKYPSTTVRSMGLPSSRNRPIGSLRPAAIAHERADYDTFLMPNSFCCVETYATLGLFVAITALALHAAGDTPEVQIRSTGTLALGASRIARISLESEVAIYTNVNWPSRPRHGTPGPSEEHLRPIPRRRRRGDRPWRSTRPWPRDHPRLRAAAVPPPPSRRWV